MEGCIILLELLNRNGYYNHYNLIPMNLHAWIKGLKGKNFLKV